MLMKLLFSGIMISVLCNINACAQGKEDKTHSLFEIAKLYRAINNFKNYKIVVIDDSEVFPGQATDNGASLTGFYRNDTLKKIVEWIGLSNKVVQNEYYLDSGQLVFVYAKESLYSIDSRGSTNHSNLSLVFQGRYYFKNGKLVERILKNEQKDYQPAASENAFMEMGKEYRKLLDARRINR